MKQYKVYFIKQCYKKKKNSPMKIGFSDDPERRLRELQTGNPNKLKVSFALPCASRDDAIMMEKNLHRLVTAKYQRLHGEWFMIYGDIIKLIRDALLTLKR